MHISPNGWTNKRQLLPAPINCLLYLTNFLKFHYVIVFVKHSGYKHPYAINTCSWSFRMSMSVVEKCITDIVIQNWILYFGCTYLELSFEFQIYISRIVNYVLDMGMRKYIFWLMNFYIRKLSDIFFPAFSMDTIALEEKCEQKNGKTMLPTAFSAKTNVTMAVATRARRWSWLWRLLRKNKGMLWLSMDFPLNPISISLKTFLYFSKFH